MGVVSPQSCTFTHSPVTVSDPQSKTWYAGCLRTATAMPSPALPSALAAVFVVQCFESRLGGQSMQLVSVSRTTSKASRYSAVSCKANLLTERPLMFHDTTRSARRLDLS